MSTTTYTDYKIKETLLFAEECKKRGYEAFIAERGTYGFYTDGNRVVSFSCDGGFKLSGNYHASRECGTGWRITDNASFGDIDAALKDNGLWANKNPIYTTKEEYLKTYSSSSKFTQI